MKKLLTLLFSILISFNSYGEWIKVTKSISGSAKGDTYYVDIDTIKENDGYVYFWVLQDKLKPDKWGDMSVKALIQGDCRLNRDKTLSYIFYKQPMGEGENETSTPSNPEWGYSKPNSVGEMGLNYVCDYVK